MRPRVIQVEYHLSHGCNLACESCSHFSQENHSGRATPQSFYGELAPWARRLNPRYVLLLGGEPLLNPDLCEILPIARELWPQGGREGVQILLVSNGLLLPKWASRLPKVLQDNDIRLDLSRHHDAPEYLEKFDAAVALARSWGIPGTPMLRESFAKWTHIYKGSGANVLPFTDGNPQRSWERCVSHWCLQIHEGMLWKCPPVAYLPMQHKKFGVDTQAWAPFLHYQPLKPMCSEAELEEFVNRKCESVCGLCPANPVAFRKPLPLRGHA